MIVLKHAFTTRLFFVQLGVLAGIALFHGLALTYEWYWHVWQLDAPVHFAGGAWVCLAAYWMLRDVAGHMTRGTAEKFFLLMTVLYVGVGWEVFEMFIGIIGTEGNDMFDSCKDVVMDMLGGSAALVLISRRILGV